ncbi:hypothetical protein U476_06900 [Acinetobacter baumannii PKAB07]|nr:hypothetical protein U476_06900 [Acinetobacter baumannii PKAB07]
MLIVFFDFEILLHHWSVVGEISHDFSAIHA